MGQDEEAERVLTVSLGIKETARALNSLGAIKAYQAKDIEALQFYNRSLSLNPNSFICLLNLGDSSRRVGQETHARDFYREGMRSALEALNENPRSGFTRAYVGYFASRLGEPDRAASEIQQALQLSPSDKTVLRRAVLTYEALGKRDEALRIVAKVPVQVLRELNRHPDLADLRRDSRFKDLVARSQEGG
jgi:tetratricopeptide (TPR) repeat protein